MSHGAGYDCALFRDGLQAFRGSPRAIGGLQPGEADNLCPPSQGRGLLGEPERGGDHQGGHAAFSKAVRSGNGHQAEGSGKDGIHALFPSTGSKEGFYIVNGFQAIKRKIEELSEISFKLKDFRSTLTSITVNGDMSRLTAMSA